MGLKKITDWLKNLQYDHIEAELGGIPWRKIEMEFEEENRKRINFLSQIKREETIKMLYDRERQKKESEEALRTVSRQSAEEIAGSAAEISNAGAVRQELRPVEIILNEIDSQTQKILDDLAILKKRMEPYISQATYDESIQKPKQEILGSGTSPLVYMLRNHTQDLDKIINWVTWLTATLE